MISTYNLWELHCDIFISDVFPYIDERTAAAVLLLLLMIIIVGYTRFIRKLRAQTKQGFLELGCSSLITYIIVRTLYTKIDFYAILCFLSIYIKYEI